MSEGERRRAAAAARGVARVECKVGKLCEMLGGVIEDTKGRIEKKAAQTYEELMAEQAEAEEVRGRGGGVRGARGGAGQPRAARVCVDDGRFRLWRGCRQAGALLDAIPPPPPPAPPHPLCQEAAVEESDSDDEYVYNPLKLPLGWDGKPIPYWLYKLHGLNMEFKCEICGNASYWGRRAFERHFKVRGGGRGKGRRAGDGRARQPERAVAFPPAQQPSTLSPVAPLPSLPSRPSLRSTSTATA